MTGGRLEMPPLRVAANILRETTERLASEVVSPGKTAPQWSDLHWAIAPVSAAIHGISGLLQKRLLWRGPTPWQCFLDEQLEHSARRHRKILSLLARLDDTLRDEGVAAVALKGASLLLLNSYSEGERPMADIDILVRPRDLDRVERALQKLSYQRVLTVSRHIVFRPARESAIRGFGEHEDHPVPIEVHTKISERLPIRSVDITQSLWPSELEAGLNAYPSPSSLMQHLLLHAACNFRRRVLRQIQLHDCTLLGQHLESAGWEDALRSRHEKRHHWWAYPPLAMTQRYYPQSIPVGILNAVRLDSRPALRMTTCRSTLADVSFSNLRIKAFPGLAWSGTPVEAVTFMISRIAPGRAALGELKADIEANQRLKQLPWYGISHGARILRWLSGRAPRVQTMLSLEAAIESAREASK